MSAALWPADACGLSSAAEALLRGAVVGFPTDTVYGLAARADSAGACQLLSSLKGRSLTQPLVLMVRDPEIQGYFEWSQPARELARRFWPGPLTLVLRAGPHSLHLGGEETVGVRIPNHPLALELLVRAGPLATSSANRHGRTPCLDARAALAELPSLAGVLDDSQAPSGGGAPSSILDLTREHPVLLREGALSAAQLGISKIEKEPGSRRD